MRHGKGEEYNKYNGNIIFRGEYCFGKRRKGKEFYNDGQLKFEGEYSNGERNGKGKEYQYYKLYFEGEYLKGKRWNGTGYNAKGKEIFIVKDGLEYQI